MPPLPKACAAPWSRASLDTRGKAAFSALIDTPVVPSDDHWRKPSNRLRVADKDGGIILARHATLETRPMGRGFGDSSVRILLAITGIIASYVCSG